MEIRHYFSALENRKYSQVFPKLKNNALFPSHEDFFNCCTFYYLTHQPNSKMYKLKKFKRGRGHRPLGTFPSSPIFNMKSFYYFYLYEFKMSVSGWVKIPYTCWKCIKCLSVCGEIILLCIKHREKTKHAPTEK